MYYSSQTRPFQSLDEAINRIQGPLNALIVSSPTFAHEAVITEASNHGLNIFTEKRVDETAEKIVRLFDILEEVESLFAVGSSVDSMYPM